MKQLSGIGRVFAIVAIVEAVTWAGLLIGMYLKYVPETTELGVAIFGRLHGAAFLAYAVIALIAWRRLRWRFGTAVLVGLAAIPPFATIPLEIWMRRTGRLSPRVVAEARAEETVSPR